MTRRGLLAGLAIELIFLIAVLGPFSLLANGTDLTDLGKLTDYQPIAAILVTLGLIGLFAFYVLGLLSVRRASRWPDLARSTRRRQVRPRDAGTALLERQGDDRADDASAAEPPDALRTAGRWLSCPSRAATVALLFTALFSLTLVFLYPITAIDVYNYAVEGHVAAYYNLNPMLTPPSQAAADRFVAYAGSWSQSTSPYGPLWLQISKLDALVAGSNVVLAVLLLKALAALCVVATAWLLSLAFRHRGPRASALAVVLYGWNPLVQIELVGNGHNDAVMALCLVAALVLTTKGRLVSGTLAAGASVLVKYLTLGAVPLVLLAEILDTAPSRRARLARVGASAVLLALLAVAAYAPFWSGLATLERARATAEDYLASIPALAVLLIPDSLGWLVLPRLLIPAIVGLWQANNLRLGRANLAQATFEVLFVTVLVSSHFAGWYLGLLVAVAALSGDRWRQARVIAFTFTTTLTTPLWAYVWYWDQGWLSMTAIHLIVVPLTFLPALLIALAALVWPRRGPAPDQRPVLSAFSPRQTATGTLGSAFAARSSPEPRVPNLASPQPPS